jgi:DNA-directed RNA polymerase specialized sigma subunit
VRKFLGASDLYKDDLHQAGRIGVIVSMDNYDHTKGNWASWAMMGIRREVLKEVHDNELPLLNNRDFQNRQRILRALSELHEENLGVMPTAEQVAARAEVTVVSAQRVINAENTVFRLDDLEGWDELNLMLDEASAGVAASDHFIDDDALDRFFESTKALPTDEVLVLLHRLNLLSFDGANGEPPPTQSEVARSMYTTRDWVRRKEEDAWRDIAAQGYPVPEEKLGRHRRKKFPPPSE